jgi:signal peptidase II
MRIWPWGLAAAVLVADQAAKWWIIARLGLEARVTVPLLPFLSLTWVENRGVSMGLLALDWVHARWLLLLATSAIALFVALWLRRERQAPEAFALGLVLGGALGNIIDRLRFGHVVDFIHLHVGHWSFYVFNVADAAITVGVTVLLLRALAQRSIAGKETIHDA